MRPSVIAWSLLGVTLVGMGFMLASRPQPMDTASHEVMNAPTLSGKFTLTDQNGKTVTESSWPGKYQILYFGFTHCPDICPTGLSAIAGALKELPKDKVEKIQPIFITVDPARDTQDVMKNYVVAFGPHWVGLTGTEQQIEDVKKNYKVYAQRDGEGADYMMNHSSFTYVMSPDNNLVTMFPHNTPPQEMAKELQKLVK